MTEPRFDRLLGGKNLPSRSEKEDVLARVLADPRVRKKRVWPVLWLGAFSAVAAAAAIFVFRAPLPEDFTARGGEELLLAVRCANGAVCRRDEKLFVGAAASKALPYFAAFLQTSDDKVWWMTPNTEAQPAAALGPTLTWLPEALQLDAQIALGDATLHGVFLDKPLTQKQIAEAFERGELKEVQRHLRVVAP